MDLQIHSVIQQQIQHHSDQTTIHFQLEELDELTDTKLKSTTLSVAINKDILQFQVIKQTGINSTNTYRKTYVIPVKAFHYILVSTQEDSGQMNANIQVFGHHGEFLLNEKLSLQHIDNIRTNSSEFPDFFATLNESVTKYINEYNTSI
ncbi:hypothetical protein CN326_10065 [Bacillus sp. AFS018417]|uniref:DUF3978 family protein n=1 Tax=Bacillus TaxID=1386 RepID=UPI000BF98B03|nr:DUF3978 family protein [Bacillus sp. AFS018417]PEZ06581.1 hypothetical protein CN326_10065 [Bacillus sp. AFS018417]